MILRKYSEKDDVAVIELWNDCLHNDTVDERTFYKRVVCDVNFDPELFILAVDGEKLLGFIYGVMVKSEPKAWVAAMAVHQNYRRSGIGKTLLSTLEEKFAESGVESIDLGANPDNYFFPGVNKDAYEAGVMFFKALGYVETGSCVSMDMSLRGYTVPAKYTQKKKNLEEIGYTFKPFSLKDSIPLFDFMKEYFPDWLNTIRATIASDRAEDTLIIAKNPEQKVVGFTARGIDGTCERFGPFGVSPTEQGTGVGSVLFHEMMKSMNEKRIFYTYFLRGEGRNIEIYSTWGMKVFCEYLLLTKKLG